MSKFFFVFIVLSLYICNSNCAAAKESEEQEYDFKTAEDALKKAQSGPEIQKVIDEFTNYIKKSKASDGSKDLWIIRFMGIILDFKEYLEKSSTLDVFPQLLGAIYESLIMNATRFCKHNMKSFFCPECPLANVRWELERP